MPEESTSDVFHIMNRDAGGGYDQYRLDCVTGGGEMMVFEHVTPRAFRSGEELIEQKDTWFVDAFLTSDAPASARQKLQALLEARTADQP